MSPSEVRTIHLPDAQTTHELGLELGRRLIPGTVILLSGDLGAGKTAIVQGIGEGLGIQDNLESPTFTLLNEYHNGRVPLYHLDLYRLTPSEVAELYLEGYWDGTEATLGIMAIEWCDRLPYLPDSSRHLLINIEINHCDLGRDLTWQVIGDLGRWPANPFGSFPSID
jgi:tRNA threonylcarbamoyladenosine biosynthesis protein TsaE